MSHSKPLTFPEDQRACFVYLSIYLSIYPSIYISLSLSMYIHMCIYACVCIYIYIYMHMCIYIYIYIYGVYMSIYLSIYISMYIYMYTYMCIYIYICVFIVEWIGWDQTELRKRYRVCVYICLNYVYCYAILSLKQHICLCSVFLVVLPRQIMFVRAYTIHIHICKCIFIHSFNE